MCEEVNKEVIHDENDEDIWDSFSMIGWDFL